MNPGWRNRFRSFPIKTTISGGESTIFRHTPNMLWRNHDLIISGYNNYVLTMVNSYSFFPVRSSFYEITMKSRCLLVKKKPNITICSVYFQEYFHLLPSLAGEHGEVSWNPYRFHMVSPFHHCKITRRISSHGADGAHLQPLPRLPAEGRGMARRLRALDARIRQDTPQWGGWNLHGPLKKRREYMVLVMKHDETCMVS